MTAIRKFLHEIVLPIVNFLRDNWKFAAWFVVVIAMGAVHITLRLANPTLTETQLFLEFWWIYGLTIIVALVGGYIWRDK